MQSLKSRVYFSSPNLKDLLQGTRLLVGVSVTSSPICDNDSELWRACGISFFERRCGSCQLTVTDKLLKGTESEHIENPNKSINPNEFLLYFPPFLLLEYRANHHNQSGQKHYLLCALWLMDIFRPAVRNLQFISGLKVLFSGVKNLSP